MRRLVAASVFLLLVSGCSQVFDSNLFSSVDPTPPLDANALKSKSPADLEALINNDTSFMKSLKGNSAALEAVHSVLLKAYQSPDPTHSSDQKKAVVNAAQADILANAFGTGASDAVSAAVSQANNLMSSGSVTKAVSALFSGKSPSEVKLELAAFQTINTAFNKMQQESANSSTGPIDSSTFFGTGNAGDLSQIALVAAALDSLSATNGGYDGLATAISGGTTLAPTASNSDFNKALDGSFTTADNPYAYVYLAKSKISP